MSSRAGKKKAASKRMSGSVDFAMRASYRRCSILTRLDIRAILTSVDTGDVPGTGPGHRAAVRHKQEPYDMSDQTLELNEIQQHVRDRYAEAALASVAGTMRGAATQSTAFSTCCGPSVSTAEVGADGSVLNAAHADGCCGDGCCTDISGTYGLQLYDAAEREGIPDAALLASLGC